MLIGQKTYIVATLAVIGAIAGYLVGDVSPADTIQLIVTALIGATLKAGQAELARKV